MSSFELTPLQQGMLYHTLSHPGLGVDIEQISFRLKEKLVVSQFERAWEIVLSRHEVLRTSFDWTSQDEPRQIFSSRVAVPLRYEDWTTVASENLDIEFDRLKREERVTDFDMTQAPLMRIILVQVGNVDWLGLWTFHHALLDGRSFPMVLHEVFDLYDGKPTESLPHRRPFRDHLRYLKGQDFAQAEQFWTRYLTDVDAPSRIVAKHDLMPSERAFDAVELRISADSTQRLTDFASQQNVSLNSMVQAAWCLLLHHYSGNDKVVFGVTRACRHASVEGSESMVGLLINTVPMRIALDPESSLADLLVTARKEQRNLRKYELTPLSEIQRWSPFSAQVPVFDNIVMFDTHSLGARMHLLGERFKGTDFRYQGQTNYPVILVAYGDEELLLRIEYSTERLDRSAADTLVRQLEKLMSAMPEHADTPAVKVPYLADGDSPIETPVDSPLNTKDTEQFWIQRLVDLELIPVPFARATRSADVSPEPGIIRIPIPSVIRQATDASGVRPADGTAATFLIYMARVHNRLQFDIGYRSRETTPSCGDVDQYADFVPLRFECDGDDTHSNIARRFADARNSVEAHGCYRLDLVDRTPMLKEIGGPFKTPVAIDIVNGDETAQPAADGTDLVVEIHADGTQIVLRCNPAAIDSDNFERMANQIALCLNSVASDMSRTLGTIEILPSEERLRLLRKWNSSSKKFDLAPSLADAFSQTAKKYPDRIALSHLSQNLTYRELDWRSNQVAHALIDSGAEPDVLVGLAMDRSIELIIAMLGILKSGAAFLPLDPAYPTDRVRYMVEHAQAPLLLTQDHLKAKIPESSAKVLIVEDITKSNFSVETPAVSACQENLAYVMYTSGSTGRPKGVQITHGNVLRLLESTRNWFHFGPEDVWTMFHSYAFDFTTWEIWGAFMYGGRLVIPSHETTRSPVDFLKLLRTEQVTVLNQTPSAFRQLIDVEGTSDSSCDLALRYVIFGGEALDLADLKPWIARHGADKPTLVNMFGITETTVHVTYRPLTASDIEQNVGSVIGVPIPDLQLYVLDQWMQLVPAGMPGEIYVGGAGLARGYLHRPDLTTERFVPNPFSETPGERLYKTGDVARYLTNGELEYLGRADQQIQLRGFRIELGEIESVLAAHERVSKVIVDVKEHASGDKQLVAYYLVSSTSVDGAELRELAAKSLSEYMIPQHFIQLDEFPLTPSGKLDRRALPAPVRALQEVPVMPASEAEQRIALIWSELLNLEKVGTRDTFFDLGGHSLLVMRLASRLASEFGRDIAVADVFRFSTIQAQARLVTEESGADNAVAEADIAASKRRSARARMQRRTAGRRGDNA